MLCKDFSPDFGKFAFLINCRTTEKFHKMFKHKADWEIGAGR